MTRRNRSVHVLLTYWQGSQHICAARMIWKEGISYVILSRGTAADLSMCTPTLYSSNSPINNSVEFVKTNGWTSSLQNYEASAMGKDEKNSSS